MLTVSDTGKSSSVKHWMDENVLQLSLELLGTCNT